MVASRDELSPELKRILELAGQREKGDRHEHAHAGQDADSGAEVDEPGCTIRSLPERLQVDAAGVAAAINPVNAPQGLVEIAASLPSAMELTITVGKYFGAAPRTLTVSFMENTPAPLRDRIILHLNAWNRCCGIRFRHTGGTGQVRISRGGRGYWSYLGTDIALIPRNQPTMNLQGFTMATPESEYKRVVRHEAGHTLGFPHEHMRKELVDRIDRQKAYDYFLRTQGWEPAKVDQQVLTPLDQASILGTPADQTSIMCYHLPATIMKSNQPILGGNDINATDCAFAGRVYPRPALFGVPEAAEGSYAETTGAPETEAALESVGGYRESALDWSPDRDIDVRSAIEEFRAEGGEAG